MGGRGSEKEVSFNSGRTVCDHLDSFRYTIIPLFQRSDGKLYILPYRFLHRGKTSDFEHRLDAEAERITWDSLKERVDFLYIAMHGRFAEDGTLQGFLEVLGIPYLGSKVMASAIGMDKIIQKEILKSKGIHVPKGFALKPEEVKNCTSELLTKRLAECSLSFPLVVKPHKEGSSIGISVVHQFADLLPAIHKASKIDPRFSQAVLVEERIREWSSLALLSPITETKNIFPFPRLKLYLKVTSLIMNRNICLADPLNLLLHV